MTDTGTSAPRRTNGSLRIGLFSYPRLVHGGGFEEYLIALAVSLTARGHDIRLVNASPRGYRALNVALNVYYRNPLLSDNSRATTADIRARLGDVELFELPVRKMAACLRSCDVIYSKNELLDLSVLWMLRTQRLPPIVCGVHTPVWYARAITPQARLHNRLYLGRVYRMLLSGVAAVHVSNSYDASLFPRVHGWSSDRVFRIRHPFAPHVRELARRVSSEGAFRVLWAGRMTEQKGVHTLLDILRAVNGSSAARDYTFVIAGSGDPHIEQEVRAIADRYPNVRYLGHVPHDDMPQLYDTADAALVTSNWETGPYSGLEAQAHGLPVVASDIPGCADIVEHGATGFLFRPGDVAEAVGALTRVNELRTRSPDELHAMREAALRQLRERHDPDRITEALERMLHTVASNRRKVHDVDR